MLIDVGANPAFPYPLRLFGVRDVLMGVLLLSSDGIVLHRHLQMSAAIDLIDAIAAAIAGFTGQISKRAAIFCCGASLIGAALGMASLGKGPLSRNTKTC
ncbi:hypothetical protein KSF_067380 [Reticulibacter mediterranei]|uniref:Uncharacterized protein n=2 Tax=Reticulibacter mediterranei TaxID=2778369 RepID=A0A8J3ITM3_9CHLR|nr:hypothetical protein KSF_067380 [Reticulibacter mediterranei]